MATRGVAVEAGEAGAIVTVMDVVRKSMGAVMVPDHKLFKLAISPDMVEVAGVVAFIASLPIPRLSRAAE